jgi:hypothetical protein
MCMEQNQNGRMGGCTKSNSWYNDHSGKTGKRGYESLFSYYEKVSPKFNEPLYTRPVRTVV